MSDHRKTDSELIMLYANGLTRLGPFQQIGGNYQCNWNYTEITRHEF